MLMKKLKTFPISVKADRAKNGFEIKSNNHKTIMKIDHKKSIDSHISQYISLISSIKKNGFIENSDDNFIEAEILYKDGNYRWKVGGEGNHRSIVLSYLGYEYINVLVTNIIRYEDAKLWPNVMNKTFTLQDARRIFDNFFKGIPCFSNKKWIDYCDKYQ